MVVILIALSVPCLTKCTEVRKWDFLRLIAPAAAVLGHVGAISLKKYNFLMFCKKKGADQAVIILIKAASGCPTHYYVLEN